MRQYDLLLILLSATAGDKTIAPDNAAVINAIFSNLEVKLPPQ